VTGGGPLRLGTRGSALARRQSELVAAELRGAGHEVDLVTIVTEGDVRPPDTAWGEGAFVGALERALRDGAVDLAVHSAKDVPIGAGPGEGHHLVIAAYTAREDPRDALVTRDGSCLEGLPAAATVGTDSPRRAAFLAAARPDLRIVPLHGNVDTRLRRLDAGEVDALVLAVAGLVRLGHGDRARCVLDPAVLPPAPAQGALAVQCRADDGRLRAALAAVDHPATRRCVEAEREVLDRTGGGCRAPLGALGTLRGGRLELLAGAVVPPSAPVVVRRADDAARSMELARSVAQELLAAGFRGDVA
jgi:hydroxymethylbilane synthase